MNDTDKELIKILQQLIKIPSWVSEKDLESSTCNENEIVAYLETWLKSNTSFDVSTQPLSGGRFNLVAKKGRPDMILLGHTDTVKPSEGAPYDMFAGKIEKDRIWGLGATDMKSGIASMIQALKLVPKVDNVWLFLYADEEYDFLGMKALIEEYDNIKPKIIISADGSDLHFGHGCRGLIEFRGRMSGQTGHPARGTGISATTKGFDSLASLCDFTDSYTHPVMGKTSFNVAHVLGGAKLSDSFDDDNRLVKVGQAGNVVSDIMDFVLDIRPASPDLSSEKIINKLKEITFENHLGFEIVEETHNLGAWYTKIDEVSEYLEIAKKATGTKEIRIDNPGASGYIDLQMFWEATGRPPAFMFGGGDGNTAHTPGEYITISNLMKTRDFFKEILINQLLKQR